MIEIGNGDGVVAEVPEVLAKMLIKHRGWQEVDGNSIDVKEVTAEEPIFVLPSARGFTPEAVEEVAAEPVIETGEPDAPIAKRSKSPNSIDHSAACDDDLPDGITFADSAYTTVVDEETGENIRVLKTHCRNDHEYSPENTRIKVRGDKAYRECQTCLAGRKLRAAAKRRKSGGET